MNTTSVPTSRYIRRRLLVALAVVGMLAIGVVAVQQSMDAAAASSGAKPPATGAPAAPPAEPGEADGVLPDEGKPTVFDDRLPAVAKLKPELLTALRAAATDAEAAGIVIKVNSGWRSAVLQEKLLEDATVQYGSREEASRWVATPEESEHVSGDAVDLGSYDALEWLSVNGAVYGLCQIYENEPWHYELRPSAIEEGCPAMYADPSAVYGHDR